MAERTLPGLGLTGFWDLGANEWNEGMDPNLLTLSAVAQLSVISATTALPGSPTNGDIYIVPDGANANKVAVRDDDAWVFLTPTEGWRAWVRDTDRLMVFDSSAWAEISGNPDAEFDSVGINEDTEAGTRLAVSSPAVLFNREVDDILLKLNKEASTDDGAVSFSTDWAVKALFGLLGSDAFTVSVSPDGSTYHRAIVIDQNTGHVGINDATPDANNALAVKGSSVLFSNEGDDMVLTVNKDAVGDDAGFYFQTNFETRAVFGLMGDDNFGLRVSDDGAAFSPAWSVDAATGHIGFGTDGDANNRMVVRGTSVLFDAETDDFRFTFNKKTATDDAAMTFQSNYSGRALIGLLGSDDFVFTVSPDGSTYTQALIIDKDTASVGFPQHPKFSGYCNYDQYNAAGAWFKIDINNSRHNDQAALSGGAFTAPHDGYFLFGVGFEFMLNNTAPSAISVGLSVNSAAPALDARADQNGGIAENDFVGMTALLKLSEGDTVEANAMFTTNDGYVKADRNYFWGHQVS